MQSGIGSRKGDLAIQYVFIIFVSVIAVFVIVGMLAKWSLSSSNIMCKLSGDCGEGGKVDKETIETDNEATFRSEIIKHAKLCFERARTSELGGELCYTIKCAGCVTSCDTDMIDRIVKTVGKNNAGVDNLDCTEFQGSDKAIIGYDFGDNKVTIR